MVICPSAWEYSTFLYSCIEPRRQFLFVVFPNGIVMDCRTLFYRNSINGCLEVKNWMPGSEKVMPISEQEMLAMGFEAG